MTFHSFIHRLIPSCLLFTVFSAGCATAPAPLRLADYSRTLLYNWNDTVPLTAAVLGQAGGTPLYLFIEGDGRAYIDRTTPSKDPTARNPVAFNLALQTTTMFPQAQVIYMARPCMWANTRADCADPSLWTTRRFDPDIITAQTSYIQKLVSEYQSKNTTVTLVGYSGGAAIALHAAATLRAQGIPVTLITVAGNLDPAATNAFHKVSAQPHWMETPYLALTTTPQHHLIGEADKIIPRELTEQYLQNLGSRCADVTLVPAATHAEGWSNAFATALTQPFTCTQAATTPSPW